MAGTGELACRVLRKRKRAEIIVSDCDVELVVGDDCYIPLSDATTESSDEDCSILLGKEELDDDNSNMYKCAQCQKRYRTAAALKSHLKSHLQLRKRGKAIKCNLCDRELRDKREVMLHVTRDHLKAKNFSCGECGKHFYTMSNRNEHVKNVHGEADSESDDGGIRCTECNKVFKTKQTAKYHMTYVHGPPRFKCGQCDKQFKHKKNLKEHLHIVHNEVD